ncbi:hypothetical protein HZH66_002512 [Vespula vulgaris]|uniref:Uncharacterized protein n=1 Tax=Vespula vulgaris TaxID=7454 RepID=A0A834NGB2_VESVU|nr:hypothetical protein HZH66_002512 [Vespula vulgaris]
MRDRYVNMLREIYNAPIEVSLWPEVESHESLKEHGEGRGREGSLRDSRRLVHTYVLQEGGFERSSSKPDFLRFTFTDARRTQATLCRTTPALNFRAAACEARREAVERKVGEEKRGEVE